jgi:hypothetical protein
MKLPVADLLVSSPVPAAAADFVHGAHGQQWKLQWQRAEEGLGRLHPGARAPASLHGDDGKDLESCGAPVVVGEPPAARADFLAARAPSADEPLPPNQGKEREAERAPVRLHVQARPADGVSVWLGIDGDAALVAQRASVAVADLRRNLQSASGERIASIVCNGVAVYPRPPSSAAPLARPQTSFLKDSP